MKKILLVVFLFFTLGMQSQEKYAVLIVGDYAAKLSDIPAEALWNGGKDYSEKGMMEFWNDTYLMWDMLKNQDYTEENIFVLFADGNDFASGSSIYTPPTGVVVTDYAADSSSVVNLFRNLAEGTNNIPQITDDDFLFVWTFGHGSRDSNNNYSILLIDGLMKDNILSNMINKLPANKKTVWMQQCHGGGFANTLQANNLVFHSACQHDQLAYRADNRTVEDYLYIENEVKGGVTYPHGEFNYHVISLNRGKSPVGQSDYHGLSYSSGDLNNDGVISFYETYVWEEALESIDDYRGEEPVYSDLGNIGNTSSLRYPTLLFDTIKKNTNARGIIGITKDLVVESGNTLSFIGNADITIADFAKIIVKEGATLRIDGNVTINGNDDNYLVIQGNFIKTDKSNLTLNNIAIETNNTLSIDESTFNNSTISAIISEELNLQPKSIVVSNCEFNNSKKDFCININGYASYNVNNNVIDSCDGIGIKIYYSGGVLNQTCNISNNSITNCTSTGLQLYSSSAGIYMNNINNNHTGIKLLNNSSVYKLSGDQSASVANTQKITNNDSYEVYMTSSCIPTNFHYNYIYDNDNTPFIYYDPHVGFASSEQVTYRSTIDVTYNNWGNITDPSAYLASYLNNTTYLWNPIWNGSRSTNATGIDSLLNLINEYLYNENFVQLQSTCEYIINNYPETTMAENAMKILFNVEQYVDNDYDSLRLYYLNNPNIQSKYTLSHLASYLANKCDEELGNWQESIMWYQNTINNPNSSYNDSLFASIDLEHLYLKLGIRNNSDWQKSTDALLSSLPHKNLYNSSEIPWTEIVTSQPEGFVVKEDGNVNITSGKGLAWLISTVNGLNGQDANSYEGLVISLENDIDISGNMWVAIGTQENPFKGTFDGQGFSINGIYMYDAWEGRNFGLFGVLDNAVIKSVVLGEGQIVGYEDCGGIAFLADNDTHIDGCIIGAKISFYNYGGGVVGTNRDSRISNCGVIPITVGVDGNYNGGIAGQNISVNADAIIENCYAVSLFGASYSSYYPGGIVGKNLTENEGHKAIVRNCYAAPLSLYGVFCGGIAGYNSKNSLIENSYTNYSSDYEICGENHGDVVNCSIFDENLQLTDNVEVWGKTTSELIEALNAWVDEFPEGVYLSWADVEDETNYGLPMFVNNIVDINEIIYNDFIIYPNPAHEYIKIESEKESEIKVYSLNGQIVLKRNINEGVSTIDISNLNSGMYFIEVDGNISKFVVR